MRTTFDDDSRMQQLILAHESERQLVVYDIHDGIVQYLASAMMHFEAARAHQQNMHPKAKIECEKVWQLLSRSMDEARSVMSRILPPILDEKGIVSAIEYLIAEHHRRHTTIITFSQDVQVESISPLIEVALFRVAQQALTNIWQHSGATEAHIDLKQTQQRIRLSVTDCGVGFELEEIDSQTVGIRGMRNRVTALSGELTIRSSKRGTRILADLPTTDELEREQQRRVKAEKEHQLAQERFVLALRATSDAIWDWDLVSGDVYRNDGYRQLFGGPPADTRDTWQWWTDRVHVDDRKRVSVSLRDAAQSNLDYGDRWSEAYRYRRADGTFANITERAFIARDDSGRPIRIIGSMLEDKS